MAMNCLLCGKVVKVTKHNRKYINIHHKDGRVFIARDKRNYLSVTICEDCIVNIDNVSITTIDKAGE